MGLPGLAATASMDGTARLWDLSTGTERARCAHQGEGVTALRYRPARWGGMLLFFGAPVRAVGYGGTACPSTAKCGCGNRGDRVWGGGGG
eukprot:3132058-Rhodomonas_salina.5